MTSFHRFKGIRRAMMVAAGVGAALLMTGDRKVMCQEEVYLRKPIPSPEELAKLPPDGGAAFNRLVFEKSPYLLQHAGNPVNWYPWGEEAFQRAKAENKPIFLSIGYSTCHWCHVMERESFENEQVGALMNKDFIAIKVDREERPDIDSLYMSVATATRGGGGWPLSIIMTPDKEPFFIATYIPRETRFQRVGMLELIPQIAAAWKAEREEILKYVGDIKTYLKQTSEGNPGEALDEKTLELAFGQLAARFDPAHGGFGQRQKFPSPHNFFFLLRYWHRTGEPRALEMVETTLRNMRQGGIFDHVGFGFHRYATDPRWLVPHFEKMLYDQAMLTMAYVETYQATGKEEYASTAREILTYVLRDMTSPEGGFYSAEDADSEGEEGKFNTWTVEEVHGLLGPEEGELYTKVFNFMAGGNYLEQSTQERTGKNIPNLIDKPIGEWAVELDIPEPELRARLEASRQKLFEVRERRIHPLKDDKILTDWNGLMIAALAKAGRALDEPRYVAAASKAADFLMANLRDERGRLLKRYRLGEAGLPGLLDDYAYVTWGLLELYEATFEVRYLAGAIELNEITLDHFWDDERGAFFLTADDGEKLLVRPKQIYDGARPSGNSVAALNLLRIGRITARPELEAKSEAVMKAFAGLVGPGPGGYTYLMSALEFATGPAYEIVIAGTAGADDTAAMLRALRREFVPNKVVLFRPDGEAPAITDIAAFTREQTSLEGKATAYVCQNYACEAPTTEVAAMLEALGG